LKFVHYVVVQYLSTMRHTFRVLLATHCGLLPLATTSTSLFLDIVVSEKQYYYQQPVVYF